MVKSPRLLFIGTSLLLLAGIHCAQAGEIMIVSPSAYKDIEGEGETIENCCGPFRFQQVFPAEDFAALGNKPHWLVDITFRPDQSLTSPRTVLFPDNQIRLATMPVGPPNLSLHFDDNLGSNFMQFYRGSWTLVTDIDGPGPGPREFYDTDFPAGVTPYLYDPSQGNLLLDGIGWQGVSPSHRGDQVPSIQTALFASSPFAPQGVRSAAIVNQFTFIPATPGDANNDNRVDRADVALVAQNLGLSGGASWSNGDFDGNRQVDLIDLRMLQSRLDYPPIAPSASAIPEPSTALVVFVGILALAARCRMTHVRLRR
jgi:hypothetical protein